MDRGEQEDHVRVRQSGHEVETGIERSWRTYGKIGTLTVEKKHVNCGKCRPNCGNENRSFHETCKKLHELKMWKYDHAYKTH
jgi:hypothetical protein